MEKRYFGVAEGRVQGVGFRFFVETQASELGLVGWVKNMDDGTVQLEVQGEAETEERLFEKIREGNMFIRVDRLTLEERPLGGDRKFVTRY